MSTLTQKHEKSVVQRGATSDFAPAADDESKVFPDGSSLVRCAQIPWTPWAMEGAEFKLLNIDRTTGMFTALIKMRGGLETPDHHHFGAAHAYVLEGEFAYEYGSINTGDYVVESGGINHKPYIGKDGALFFVIFQAGISGVSEKGLPEGDYVDCDWMYRAAAENGAADHLPPPPHQELNAK